MEVNNQLFDFLDFSCKLFDKAETNWNAIMGILKILRERFKLIDDDLWNNLSLWIAQHKKCGSFLRLAERETFKQTYDKEVLVLPKK